jgi:hypothetical protein
MSNGSENNKTGLTGTATAALLALGGSALLTGCATQQPKLVLAPVGPAPLSVNCAPAAEGSLLVFSAYEPTAGANWEDTCKARYSSYRIFSPEGKLVKRVYNNTDSFVEHPQQVELPAGNYCVVAEANRYGRVTVPVLIAGNQVTVLHLEGDGFWPREGAFTENNTVRLPHGEIVGWRANVATPPAGQLTADSKF